MKLNFLDSGVDSLSKGFKNLIVYEGLQYNNNLVRKKKERHYYLKDAILFIQHGIEILFKQIIFRHSEYLLFSHIDDHVKRAFREKKERKLKSVFESDAKHKIHTVSFTESIERLKLLPGVVFSKKLEEKVRALEVYRNIIMHAEPYLDENAINQTFDGLASMLDVFFFENLGKRYRTISGYGEFVKNFEKFQEVLTAGNQHLKAETLRVFMNGLKSAGLSMGTKELKRFTDIEGCAKFLDVLFSSTLVLGTDIYNGYCAGRTKVTREGKDLFKMNAEERMFFCEFKLKSLILYLPDPADQASPIIFIESDSFVETDLRLKDSVGPDYHDIIHVDYYRLSDGSVVTGEENMDAFYDENTKEEYESVIRFYSSGIMCFMNVQGLEFNYGLKYLVERNRFTDGKDFEVGVRTFLNSIDRH